MAQHDSYPATSAMAAVKPLGVATSHQPTTEESDLLATLPGGSAILIGLDGQFKGARFLITPDTKEGSGVTVAGRSPDSDIYLDDVTVSRRHALFMPNAGSYILTDAGSLNGTYVNGDRVDEAYLKNGDEIYIGKFHFAFYQGKGN